MQETIPWDGVYRDWTKIVMEKEPKNNQAEKIEVLEPCIALCKKLLTAGIILKYRRLDAKDLWHEDGEPDLEIWIPYQEEDLQYVLILLAECKRKDGGVHGPKQIAYMEKYKPFSNTMYELITTPDQLDYLIRKLSDVKVYMDDFNSFQCEPTINQSRPGEDI